MLTKVLTESKKSYCRNGFYDFSQGFNSPRLHHDKTAQNISFGRFLMLLQINCHFSAMINSEEFKQISVYATEFANGEHKMLTKMLMKFCRK